jgi:hypothetical protein
MVDHCVIRDHTRDFLRGYRFVTVKDTGAGSPTFPD